MFNELFIVGFDFDQEREQQTGPVKIDPYRLKDARGNPVIAIFTRWSLADAFIKRMSIGFHCGLAPVGLPQSSAMEFVLSHNKAGVSGFTINPEAYATMPTAPLADALAELVSLYYEEGVKDGKEESNEID